MLPESSKNTIIDHSQSVLNQKKITTMNGQKKQEILGDWQPPVCTLTDQFQLNWRNNDLFRSLHRKIELCHRQHRLLTNVIDLSCAFDHYYINLIFTFYFDCLFGMRCSDDIDGPSNGNSWHIINNPIGKRCVYE